jgi:hypothetical protein
MSPGCGSSSGKPESRKKVGQANANEKKKQKRIFTQWRTNKHGCQMVHFRTKNPNLGIFLVGLGVKNIGIF